MNTAYTELALEKVHEEQVAAGETDISDFNLWIAILGFELRRINGGEYYVSHTGL